MTPLRRYDRVWGIQIGKVEGMIKAEGVGLKDREANNDTAPTAEITELDSDKDGNSSDKENEGRKQANQRPKMYYVWGRWYVNTCVGIRGRNGVGTIGNSDSGGSG